MSITIGDVKHIAQLARIELTTHEEDKMLNELGSIIKFIDKLKELDTNGVEPTAQVTGMESITREDINPHEAGIWTDKMLDQAPKTKDGYVQVKGTLKKNGY